MMTPLKLEELCEIAVAGYPKKSLSILPRELPKSIQKINEFFPKKLTHLRELCAVVLTGFPKKRLSTLPPKAREIVEQIHHQMVVKLFSYKQRAIQKQAPWTTVVNIKSNGDIDWRYTKKDSDSRICWIWLKEKSLLQLTEAKACRPEDVENTKKNSMNEISWTYRFPEVWHSNKKTTIVSKNSQKMIETREGALWKWQFFSDGQVNMPEKEGTGGMRFLILRLEDPDSW